MTTPEIPADVLAAAREGHTLKPAPGLVPGVHRWTCTTCGDLVFASDSAIYGGATTRTCTESQAFWGAAGGPDGDD